MRDGDIIIIESVKELWDDKKQEVVGRIITDKAGNETKIKKGPGGKLQERWEWLDENVGKAIKLTVGEFKGYPYVSDFTVVKDELVAQAAEKAQVSQSGNKDRAVAISYAHDFVIAKIIKPDEIAEWAEMFYRYIIGTLRVDEARLITLIGGSYETIKDTPSSQEAETKSTDRQDSGEATDEERIAGFFKYLENHGIKDVRLWLNVEYGIDPDGELTPKKCEALYKTIKKDKRFND